MNSLLPPNATELEKKLELLSDIQIDSIVATLWDANKCPEQFLKLLAIGLSVDYWDESWSEDRKRQEIQNSILIHRIKGTKKAITIALSTLAADVDIKQWYELIPQGRPRTFKVILSNQQEFLDSKDINEAIKKVKLVKPISAHFDFTVEHKQKAQFSVVGALGSIKLVNLKTQTKSFSAISLSSVAIIQNTVFLSLKMEEK